MIVDECAAFPWRVYPAWKRAQVGDLRMRVYPCYESDGWIRVLLRPRFRKSGPGLKWEPATDEVVDET